MRSRHYSNQVDLARHVIEYLEDLREVESATLKGSVATGTWDEFSDIDIVVYVGERNNAAFALQLPRLMDREFEVVFSDWAPSLLPEKLVQTFYIEDVSIFWSIDLRVTARVHGGLRTDPPRDEEVHYLKLWCQNLKYWIRDDPRHERSIPRMAGMILSDDALADLDLRDQMVQSLEYLTMTSLGRKRKFIAQCLEARKQYLGQ